MRRLGDKLGEGVVGGRPSEQGARGWERHYREGGGDIRIQRSEAQVLNKDLSEDKTCVLLELYRDSKGLLPC